MSNINLIYYLIAGTAFVALALKTGIPAAPLAGALIGASILGISGKVEPAEWPNGTRTILEINSNARVYVQNMLLFTNFIVFYEINIFYPH